MSPKIVSLQDNDENLKIQESSNNNIREPKTSLEKSPNLLQNGDDFNALNAKEENRSNSENEDNSHSINIKLELERDDLNLKGTKIMSPKSDSAKGKNEKVKVILTEYKESESIENKLTIVSKNGKKAKSEEERPAKNQNQSVR